MADEITTTTEPQETATVEKPKTYKRGELEVSLSTYLDSADLGFANWLQHTRFKDKEKRAVQEAFGQLMLGIKDGTLTYTIGGGFRDTSSHQYTNAKKGFDAYGYAAGYLGNILRNQEVYKEPVDTSKISYSGIDTIADWLTDKMSGGVNDDDSWQQDWIDLDTPGDNFRTNAVRTKRLQGYLQTLHDNWDNLFTGFEPAKKKEWEDLYASAMDPETGIFKDNQISDDEYLTLRALTGLNLRDLMSTTYTKPTDNQAALATPAAATAANEDGTVALPDITSDEVQNYLKTTYPRDTNYIELSMNVNDTAKYGSWTLELITNRINACENKTLAKGVLLYSRTPHKVLYAYAKPFQVLVNGVPIPYNNAKFIELVLDTLLKRNYLIPCSDNNEEEYIVPNSIDTKNTALVWNKNTKRLIRRHILDIPYLKQKAYNNYLTKKVPTHKQGGVIKFEPGGKTDIWEAVSYDDDALKKKNRYRWTWQNGKLGLVKRNTLMSTDKIAPKNGAYDPELDDVNGVKTDLGKQIEALPSYNKFMGLVESNENLGKAWVKGYGHYNTTDTKHMTRFTNALGEYDQAKFKSNRAKYTSDGINGTGHDVIKGKTYRIEGENGTYYSAPLEGYDIVGDPESAEDGLIDIYTLRKKAAETTPTTSTQATPETTPEGTAEADKSVSTPAGTPAGTGSKSNAKGSDLYERYLKTLQNPEPKSNKWNSWLLNSLGAGRLGLSLWSNNKITDVVDKSLKAVLKNPFEKYSPVTGDFGGMLFKNKQAADVMHLASRPVTSDATQLYAQMLNGLEKGNQLRTEGWLSDNQKIATTMKEALQRAEDNLKLRSEVADFNRQSINTTNREKAQLEATRLKSNWSSWDEFLKGIESDWKTKIDENNQFSKQFQVKVGTDAAQKWYSQVMSKLEADKKAWEADTKNDGKDYYDNNPASKLFSTLANYRYKAMINELMAKAYNQSYLNPYTLADYDTFDFSNRMNYTIND